MPKADNDQEQVESTTGSEPTSKPEPTKVVEKATAPEDQSDAEKPSNGVSTSLKRKSTGEVNEDEATGEKTRRLSVEEVPAEEASNDASNDAEASSDVPQASEGGDGEFEKVPPWVHSDMPPQEIGWRMGDLEQYKFDFWDWFVTLADDEQQRFKEKYPPPAEWAGFYDNESENEEDNEESQ